MLVLLTLAAVATVAPGHAYAAGKAMTVKGEIVDLACYLDSGAKGAQHKACALTCLKGGEPMGLLTADGTLYLLTAPHSDDKAFQQAKEMASEQVEVTGPEADRGGMKSLTVESVRKM